MAQHVVDLPVDLNSEDDSGLPWAFLDEAHDRSVIVEGAWIVVVLVPCKPSDCEQAPSS